MVGTKLTTRASGGRAPRSMRVDQPRAAQRADLRLLGRKGKIGDHVDALTGGDANGLSCDARLNPLAVADGTHYVQLHQDRFGVEYDRGDGQRVGEQQRDGSIVRASLLLRHGLQRRSPSPEPPRRGSGLG
jgi:hypothetical protein